MLLDLLRGLVSFSRGLCQIPVTSMQQKSTSMLSARLCYAGEACARGGHSSLCISHQRQCPVACLAAHEISLSPWRAGSIRDAVFDCSDPQERTAKSKGEATACVRVLAYYRPHDGARAAAANPDQEKIGPGRHRATAPNAARSLLRLRPVSALADLGHTCEVQALTGCCC